MGGLKEISNPKFTIFEDYSLFNPFLKKFEGFLENISNKFTISYYKVYSKEF